MIKIENYFCSIEPCMLLSFKNNNIASEALMQFFCGTKQRQNVSDSVFLTFENAIGAKLLKFCNFSQEVLHTSTYISAVHFSAIARAGNVYLVSFWRCYIERHARVAQNTQN